jgi:phosphomethylpyrimidine synthase
MAHFCSMCGPKFCSMAISQNIRKQFGSASQQRRVVSQAEQIIAGSHAVTEAISGASAGAANSKE